MATERNYEAEMKLPRGYTCDDCVNFGYCVQLIGSEIKGNTSCDWAPSRFRLMPSIPGLRSPFFVRLVQSLLLMLFAVVVSSDAQTVTVQTGVGASSNLGTRPGPVLEARLEHPWLYSRLRFSWEKKAYLDSGRIVTGDLMARFSHRKVWAGAGFEVSHASTVAYQKTALRLLLGGGYRAPRWGAAVFGFAPETNTQNRSAGLRGQLDLIPWRAEKLAFVITARPYLLRYHNGPEWERVRSGAGLDLLAGMRWGK